MELILFVAIIIGGYVFVYNGLVKAKFKVEEGWSGITVQLKRRHELVPNLVSAVRSAMEHETAILDAIIDARLNALSALAKGDHGEVNEAEAALSSALGKFVGYTEDNPEVTATANIGQLQSQLEETEDQISAARRLYNGNVQAYNTKVMSIPWNFIASMKGFKIEAMYDVSPVEMKQISAVPNITLSS
ncbi:MAG: LemA family protein [Pseudomonadota bacterium]